MRSVFIRHKPSTTSEILQDLWERREIAIHYQNIRSTDPDKYEQSGRNALRRLHRYCQTGAIVGATYRQIQPIKILVGMIPEDSTIRWIDRYGEDFIYKVVQLQNVKEISLADYPVLGAIQPRQSTITEWPSASVVLWAIVNGIQPPPSVDILSPGQLEVMCYEYLRMKDILKILLLPIGRNLQNIDILGIGEGGKTIFAQVTHSQHEVEVNNKLRILKEYKAQDAVLLYFGPKSCLISDSDVSYISIENVFAELHSSKEVIYRLMIERMIGC